MSKRLGIVMPESSEDKAQRYIKYTDIVHTNEVGGLWYMILTVES